MTIKCGNNFLLETGRYFIGDYKTISNIDYSSDIDYSDVYVDLSKNEESKEEIELHQQLIKFRGKFSEIVGRHPYKTMDTFHSYYASEYINTRSNGGIYIVESSPEFNICEKYKGDELELSATLPNCKSSLIFINLDKYPGFEYIYKFYKNYYKEKSGNYLDDQPFVNMRWQKGSNLQLEMPIGNVAELLVSNPALCTSYIDDWDSKVSSYLHIFCKNEELEFYGTVFKV